MTLDARGAYTFTPKGARQWDAAAIIRKDDKNQSPDCMASKSTVVTTPEGEDVEVNFNMGTGEVTYGKKTGCCSTSPTVHLPAVAVVQSKG